MAESQTTWRIAGLATLPVRFVQGWIFWGGGSRRFIYDPSKLDPHAHEWMANKLQSAMPGAILGVDKIISFLVLHFDLLYPSIILFSLAELLAGLALITGFCTRLAAFITIFISIILMLAFGWQGATCMDEWTMAVATLAMGLTLTLSGASAFSIDNMITRRKPALAKKWWFPLIFSGPLSTKLFKRMAKIFVGFAIVFTLITYNYYRGSIFTPYHSGPVSAGPHHIRLTDGSIRRDGTVTVTMYVDAGTPALPSNIIRIDLLNANNKIINSWGGAELTSLAKDNINNIYAYNEVRTGIYGLVAPLSAKAVITFPPDKKLNLVDSTYQLIVLTINGEQFETPLTWIK